MPHHQKHSKSGWMEPDAVKDYTPYSRQFDEITLKVPFQLKLFCDSMVLHFSHLHFVHSRLSYSKIRHRLHKEIQVNEKVFHITHFYIWQLKSSLLAKHECTQTGSVGCYNNSSNVIVISFCCLQTGERWMKVNSLKFKEQGKLVRSCNLYSLHC